MSDVKDYSHLEASGGGEVDHNGWPKKPPISDRECIYLCLENCEELAGLDKKQVLRLMQEFEVERTVVEIQNEYPPL